MDSASVTKETIGLSRWTNKQNALRFQKISDDLHEKYGITFTEITGHIHSLRADNNRLSSEISKAKQDVEELRQFIESCVAYKRFQIYAINEQKTENKKEYYEKHDSQLDTYHDALFTLEQRNIDVNSITTESIKIMQQRLKDAEVNIQNQEELQKQNARDLKELSD